MSVSEAVARRMSVRAFLPDPVPGAIVAEILEKAARAPSGGNLQPWRVHALTGAPLADLLAQVKSCGPDVAPGYEIYPQNLWEPYRTRRFSNGEQLYAAISVAREDKAGRLKQLARNAEFFGAPVGIFILVDRKMGPPQWSDLGMYIQTLMLLAVERGLATCPQEYWAVYAKTVERFLGAPDDQMLFCGVALGFCDETAPINAMRTDRAPAQEWMTTAGF
ncbi:MAG: nitroreductase [Rhodoblastus sp.]